MHVDEKHEVDLLLISFTDDMTVDVSCFDRVTKPESLQSHLSIRWDWSSILVSDISFDDRINITPMLNSVSFPFSWYTSLPCFVYPVVVFFQILIILLLIHFSSSSLGYISAHPVGQDEHIAIM